MRLITVTRKVDGKKMYVNPMQVCAVYPFYSDNDITVIQFSGEEMNYIKAIESADTIANMINAAMLTK